jgi:hypothetical protein
MGGHPSCCMRTPPPSINLELERQRSYDIPTLGNSAIYAPTLGLQKDGRSILGVRAFSSVSVFFNR